MKKVRRKYSRQPLPSLYEDGQYTDWLKQPFTTSLRDISQTLIKQNLAVKHLDSTQLTELARYYQGSSCTVLNSLQFTIQDHRLGVDAYLDHIVKGQGIPLKPRQNHDLLNALMWISLPYTRYQCTLEMVSARALRSIEEPKRRSKLEDRLTLFDESGIAVFSHREDLLELIRHRQWKTLFWSKRDEVLQDVDFWIVGHGLYEQLILPFVGLVAYGRLYAVEKEIYKQVQDSLKYKQQVYDRLIAEDLKNCGLKQELSLHALPFLGYPGWWHENNKSSFYDNQRYFRGPYEPQDKQKYNSN